MIIRHKGSFLKGKRVTPLQTIKPVNLHGLGVALCYFLSVSPLILLKRYNLLKRGVVFTHSHDHDDTAVPAQTRKSQVPQGRSSLASSLASPAHFWLLH